MSGTMVDRVALVQLVAPEVDLEEAETLVATWLDDHPEVADAVTVALTHAGAAPREGLESALLTVEELLSPETASWPGEQIALAVGVPADEASAYDALLHPDAVERWAVVVPGVLPGSAADVPDVVATACRDLVFRVSAGELPGVALGSPAQGAHVGPVVEPALVAEVDETSESGIHDVSTDPTQPAPVRDAVSRRPVSPGAPVGDVDLLYVVVVGEAHEYGRTTARRRWLGRLLDQVGEQPGRHAVRLLAVGDGISGQSPLAPAAEFRTPRRWRRRTHAWPSARGVLAQARFEQDLVDVVRRDRERLAADGLVVGDCDCVVVVSDTLAGQGVFGEGLRRLAEDVRFLWVTPQRRATSLYAPFSPTVGEVLVDHAEIDEEVARKLGLRRPVFAVDPESAASGDRLVVRR